MGVKSKARDYTRRTIRRLDTLSRNQCFAPNCYKTLVARDGETLISKICHIEAANEQGPRFNKNMNDDQRRHFDNLILLCDECHSIIDNKDNESEYTVPLLQEWKKSHESIKKDQINLNPSLLIQAINAVAEANFDDVKDQSLRSFTIEDKISFNYIERNKSLIEEYKIYYSKLAILYRELEEQGSFKKEKLLRNIRQIYLKVRGKYVGNPTELEKIRASADDIFDDVEEEIAHIIEKKGYHTDDFYFSISVIIVDAFMRCKIFEEPAGRC